MRFSIGFLATVGVLLVGAALVNARVNPYAIYPTEWFEPVASNDLDRALKLLETPGLEPQLVVVGSSRSSRLRPRDLECYSGLASANASFSNATPDAYFALMSYLMDTKPAPKVLIVGVDVESIQPASKFGDRLGNVPRLTKYLRPTRIEGIWHDATQLFSFAQLSDSVRVLMHALNPEAAAEGENGATDTEAAPPLKIIENRDEDTPRKALTSYQKRFADYAGLDEEQKGYFEGLMQLARAKNVQVKVFITPLSPALTEVLNKQGVYPKRLGEVRDWLSGLAGKYGFEFYDFSTIETFGGTVKDFYNLAHINDSNSARLIGAMFYESGRASVCGPKS